LPPQPFDALLPGESDGPHGEAQLGGDFGVGPRRYLKEEKLNEAAALWRQHGHRFPKHLFFLRLLHQSFRDWRYFRLG